MGRAIQSVKIMGVNIYPYQSLLELTNKVVEKKPLFSVNAEILLHDDEKFKNVLNSGIGYPDGIGAVWALKKKGIKAVKLPGCELWLEILKRYSKDLSFYFVGSTEEVITKTMAKIKDEYPGISIVGYRNGYIKSDEEKSNLIKDVMEKKPDVVYIAMGFPKQEFLISELYKVHQAAYLGLGGSFDVYVGNVKRAPQWWIDHNLEFAYRLIKQPSRIKRQLPLLRFITLLTIGRI